MSVPEREQEENRRKKTCSSSGLGLAAAAIGVGVGAALYYFLSKRPEENRESGASSSENWSYEEPQSFSNNESYSTASEHSTTDTSINDSPQSTVVHTSTYDASDTGSETSVGDTDVSSDSRFELDSSVDSEDSHETGYNTLRVHINSQNANEDSYASDSIVDSEESSGTGHEVPFHMNSTYNMDSDVDWDVTDSSLGVPEVYRPSIFDTISHHIVQVFSPNVGKHRPNHENTPSLKFRQRTWSLEECSICFDVMLKDQELLALPCTHRFHVGCIGPWLEAQQTCPNCRKSAE